MMATTTKQLQKGEAMRSASKELNHRLDQRAYHYQNVASYST